MKAFMLAILVGLSFSALPAQTIPPPGAKSLASGELVKITTWGGNTRNGPAWSQIVVTTGGEIRRRSHEGSTRAKLSRPELRSLLRLMRNADWRAIRRTPYKETYPPSAADGTDLVLSFRYGKRVQSWANFEHERPQRAPLFQGLAKLLTRHKIFVPL